MVATTRLGPGGYPVANPTAASPPPPPSPFYQTDWQVPPAPLRTTDLRTWLQSPDVSRGPLPQGFNPDLSTAPKGPLQGSTSLKTWTDPTKTWLIGKDSFFGLAGAPQFDWPVPKTAIGSVSLLTWIDATKTQLIGKDAQRFNQYDWPVPKTAIGSVSLRTWVNPLNAWLVGKDQFFGVGGPDYDYPNPRGPVGSLDLRTWLQGYSLNLFAVAVVQSPFYQTDWPIPRGYSASIDLRTWIQRTSPSVSPLPQGFNPDLSTPRGALSNLRCNWTDSSKTWLIGKDQFFGLAGNPNFDWPVPKAATPALDLRTWLQGFSLEFDRPPVVTSFDLGNPRGATPALSLKTHINVSPTWLIGKDATRFNQYDWLLPRAARQAVQQSVWSLPGTLTLTVQAPFAQYDWPLPLSPVYPIDLRTLLQGWTLPLQPQPEPVIPRDIDAVLTKRQLEALRARLAGEKKRKKRDFHREQQSRQELRTTLESFFRDAPVDDVQEIAEQLPVKVEAAQIGAIRRNSAELTQAIDWPKLYDDRALMDRMVSDLSDIISTHLARQRFEAEEDDLAMLMLVS